MAKKKNPVGRPSGFKDEFADQLIEYFSAKPYTEKENREVAGDVPTLAGFAIKLGVSRDTLLEWASALDETGSLKYPEFSGAYKRARDYQENWLATNTLKNLVNPAFAIFMAKNVIGWRDKQPGETDVIVNNFNAKSDQDLDARISQLLEKVKES